MVHKFERFVFQTAAHVSHYRYPSDKADSLYVPHVVSLVQQFAPLQRPKGMHDLDSIDGTVAL
jgi:hypothetical protein